MLTAEMYARVRALMCSDFRNCETCGIWQAARDALREEDLIVTPDPCNAFAAKYPAEAVKITHLWWEKNKERYGQFQL